VKTNPATTTESENLMSTDDVAAPNRAASLLNFSESPFVDDDSWAEPPRAADRRLQIAAVLLGLGVVAVTFFTIGANVGKNRAASPVAGLGAFGGRGAGGFGGLGGGIGGAAGGRARAFLPTVGKVTKVDGKTITMTTSEGTSVVVNLAEDTSIGRRTTKKANDIAVGDEISVRGTTGDDGVLAATAATVGDVEPSVLPVGAAGGPGGVGLPALPSDASPGVGLGSGTASAVTTPDLAAEPSTPTTTPTLGGLLPTG
jgi:hypothetical protein